MTETADLAIFLSWSGQLSKSVASDLRAWIPKLFDNTIVFMSDTDIQSGTRGLSRIENELRRTNFGVLVVTRENYDAPWLNFEAGAISNAVGGNPPRVVPLLVDLASEAEITGPLTQFQAILFDKDNLNNLALEIGEILGVNVATVNERFESFWPALEASVHKLLQSNRRVKPEKRSNAAMLEEVVATTRALHREVVLKQMLPDYTSELEDLVRVIFAKHGYQYSDLSVSVDENGKVGWNWQAGEDGTSEASKAALEELEKYLGKGQLYRLTGDDVPPGMRSD